MNLDGIPVKGVLESLHSRSKEPSETQTCGLKNQAFKGFRLTNSLKAGMAFGGPSFTGFRESDGLGFISLSHGRGQRSRARSAMGLKVDEHVKRLKARG